MKKILYLSFLALFFSTNIFTREFTEEDALSQDVKYFFDQGYTCSNIPEPKTAVDSSRREKCFEAGSNTVNYIKYYLVPKILDTNTDRADILKKELKDYCKI